MACRVIKTARKLGIQTVAIYSEIDRYSRHVKLVRQRFKSLPKNQFLMLTFFVFVFWSGWWGLFGRSCPVVTKLFEHGQDSRTLYQKWCPGDLLISARVLNYSTDLKTSDLNFWTGCSSWLGISLRLAKKKMRLRLVYLPDRYHQWNFFDMSFLERAEFAEKLKTAGITWIGPPSSAIISMGSKSESKQVWYISLSCIKHDFDADFDPILFPLTYSDHD